VISISRVAIPLLFCSRASKASTSSNARTKATNTAIKALTRLDAALKTQQTALEDLFGGRFDFVNRSVRDLNACPEYRHRDDNPSYTCTTAATHKARAEAHVAIYKVFRLGISQTDFETAAGEALDAHGASRDYESLLEYMYIDNSPVTMGEETRAKVRLGLQELKSKLPWAD
jgi:hypothetical protein